MTARHRAVVSGGNAWHVGNAGGGEAILESGGTGRLLANRGTVDYLAGMPTPNAHQSPDLAAIGAAIGRIPSCCAILTATHNGVSTGMLASWIQQASFEPPCVSVCVKRGRPIAGLIVGSGRFALNLVGDPPATLFKHFGKGFSPDEDAFAGLSVSPSEFGPLLESAISRLRCRVLTRVSIGDHDAYFGEVVAADGASGAMPYIHLRKSGLNY